MLVEALPFCGVLDLSSVMSHVERGLEWESDRVERAEQNYRRFLALCKVYPTAPFVPNVEIDLVWRLHASQGVKYEQDCYMLFGRVLPPRQFDSRGDMEMTRKYWREAYGEELK